MLSVSFHQGWPTLGAILILLGSYSGILIHADDRLEQVDVWLHLAQGRDGGLKLGTESYTRDLLAVIVTMIQQQKLTVRFSVMLPSAEHFDQAELWLNPIAAHCHVGATALRAPVTKPKVSAK